MTHIKEARHASFISRHVRPNKPHLWFFIVYLDSGETTDGRIG